jgi:hypothetical protein
VPTAVHAEDLVLDAGSQRQPVEKRIQARPGPDAVRIAQPLDALDAEPEKRVDVCRLLKPTRFDLYSGWCSMCSMLLQGCKQASIFSVSNIVRRSQRLPTSWLPRIKCTCLGCSILSASSKQMVSSECAPRST